MSPSITIENVETDVNEVAVTFSTSDIGSLLSSEIDIQLSDGGEILADRRLDRIGNTDSETVTFDLNLNVGEARDMYVDANLLEPEPDFDSEFITVNGPSTLFIDATPVVDGVDVLVDVIAPEPAVVDIALNTDEVPTETLDDERYFGSESFQKTFYFRDLGIDPGTEQGVFVDVNLLEPQALFESELVSIDGPQEDEADDGDTGDGTDGGDGGDTEPTFDPALLSVQCAGVPSSVAPRESFSVQVGVTNENAVAAEGRIDLFADGEQIGVANGVAVPANSTESVTIEALAPQLDTGQAEFAIEATAAGWSETTTASLSRSIASAFR